MQFMMIDKNYHTRGKKKKSLEWYFLLNGKTFYTLFKFAIIPCLALF